MAKNNTKRLIVICTVIAAALAAGTTLARVTWALTSVNGVQDVVISSNTNRIGYNKEDIRNINRIVQDNISELSEAMGVLSHEIRQNRETLIEVKTNQLNIDKNQQEVLRLLKEFAGQ